MESGAGAVDEPRRSGLNLQGGLEMNRHASKQKKEGRGAHRQASRGRHEVTEEDPREGPRRLNGAGNHTPPRCK